MNGILWAFAGTLFTLGVTVLGALNVFWVKKEAGHNIQSVFLGFAGGVMIAASVWSLLLPGIERARENGQIVLLIVPGGFLLGVFLLSAIDAWLRQRCRNIPMGKSTLLLVLAITVHNIPEGMAVGLAFALAAQSPENPELFSGAIALALGIGIQNYPEGTAVALPLIREGMNKKKAFWIGSMSAVVEPVFGVLAAAMAGWITSFMPMLLGLAAGAMIYVVVEELIPEANTGGTQNKGTLGFVLGFLVMMILDVALG